MSLDDRAAAYETPPRPDPRAAERDALRTLLTLSRATSARTPPPPGRRAWVADLFAG